MSAVRAGREVSPHVRDYSFGRDLKPQRWWLDGDPIASAIFDGLSATFPHGERFFMDALRPYRDEAPERLRDQITTFIRQEAMHTREHITFNRHIAAHGRDLHAADLRSKAVVDIARAGSPLQQLAATAALEHFTAVLGHVVLKHPKYLKGADPEIARLWRWHSLEEIEHKAVAFDTLAYMLRGAPPWRRWAVRTSVMARMSLLFSGPTLGNIVQILQDDGFSKARIYGGLVNYVLASPGLIWDSVALCLAYYRPGFHPWDLDDRHLLVAADQDLTRDMAEAQAIAELSGGGLS